MENVVQRAMAINSDPRMSQDELLWLYQRFEELNQGGNTLEIGAYRGMLSYLMAEKISRLGKPESKHFIVDVFDIPIDNDESTAHHYGIHTEEELLEKMGDYAKFIKTIRSKSLDWLGASEVMYNEFDYCFIDGDHRDPVVYLELIMCHHSVKHILGHDYGWKGVTLSVDRFCKEFGYTIHQPLSGRGVFELTKIEPVIPEITLNKSK
jgi:hypothetical protein